MSVVAARPHHAGSWPPPAAQTSRRAARPRLLLVDDDPRTRDTVRLLLRAGGVDAEVVVVHCGREALALGRCHDVDLGRGIGGVHQERDPAPFVPEGLDHVEAVHVGQPQVDDQQIETRARQLGAVAVIDKLADGDPLVEGLRIALARHARTRRGSG